MERLRISDNRRFFETQDGEPFTWIADTAWTLPQRMKWDDIEYYMQKRKEQGFTVLQIVALDPERDEEMRNPMGIKALKSDDITDPDELYFLYLDWILDRAEFYGFYVLLLPAWGQLVTGDNWSGKTFPKLIDERNAAVYGEWIGRRYKDRPNILWCLGGDRHPVHKGTDYRPVWRRMAEGLAKGINGDNAVWDGILMTYHTCYDGQTGACSTMTWWTGAESWISFIMIQSGHGTKVRNYEWIEQEYAGKKTMPVWDGEPAYERMPTSWPEVTDYHGAWSVRKRAYWSLFAGAFGYTYGHASMWCSISEKERGKAAAYTWFEAMGSEGAVQMKYLRDFMASSRICTCRPAQEVLLTQKEEKVALMDMHRQACMSSDRTEMYIYFPSGGTESINTEQMNGREIYVWWYNPRDGQFYDQDGEIAEKAAVQSGRMKMSLLQTPSCGSEQDWVAVICTKNTGRPVTAGHYYKTNQNSEQEKVFDW